ncbi:MAG TPA: hypothetical protein VHQ94_06405, partial [Pyrinomonadaceae bacterium]|nr:hypothetical protein [Pyrinomonadaceae bacterium]
PIWIGGSAEHMVRFGLGTALPGTVVLDREGKVAKIISGVVNQATLRKEIESLHSVASVPDAPAPGKDKKAEVSSVPS